MRYWYQGQPQRGTPDASHDVGTMRYWYMGQVDGWLPGLSTVGLTLAAAGRAGSYGKATFSTLAAGLSGKGRSAGRGRGLLVSAMPIFAKGLSASWSRVGPQSVVLLRARGMAGSTGRALGRFYFQLAANGRATGSGRLGAVTLLFPLKAAGRAMAAGRVKFRAVGVRVITFTSYWSRRRS